MTSIPTTPAPSAGGTHLLSYRPYRGNLGGPLGGSRAIARAALATMFRRKLFWVLYAASLFIFMFFFFGQYIASWLQTQSSTEPVPLFAGTNVKVNTSELVGLLRTQLKLNGTGETYRNVIWYEGSTVMAALALAGALLIGNDFRHGSLPFFLSKPLGRWHYVLGKCAAIAVLVHLITTVPALILWIQYGLLDSWSYYWDAAPLALGIIAYGTLLSVLMSLLVAALASWLRTTVPMVMVWTAIFVMAPALANVLARAWGDVPRWRLFDLWNDVYVVGNACMGLKQDANQPAVWEAALVLTATATLCLNSLNRRIRAVEVA